MPPVRRYEITDSNGRSSTLCCPTSLAGFRALRLLAGVGAATASRWLDALESSSDPAATMRARLSRPRRRRSCAAARTG